MGGFWYRLLQRTSGTVGSWFLILVSRIVALGYFLFSRRTAESYRLYRLLYPDRKSWYHRWCTFRQYQGFTTIHLDRFLRAQGDHPICTARGWGRLEEVVGRQGGVLLMSHLGNWEMAASLLRQQREDLQLLLYMGVKEKEGIERQQKEDLRRSGVRIIGVDQEGGSPFSAVEGIRFLEQGGLISMAGDIVWRNDQRRVEVSFLGGRAWLPEAPYVFAMVSGVPLFAFFAVRRGRNTYHITLSEPISVKSASRDSRRAAIQQAAQKYADLLERSLRENPFEWYHFERFVH